jgi:succinate dehydrogenase hydrophobic anchor subunit
VVSLAVTYVVAALLIPLTVWLLFLWQRPDDQGGALIYGALESGFWRAVWWLLLVVAAIAIALPVVRWVLMRLVTPTRDS